jgi:hypothetical protein
MAFMPAAAMADRSLVMLITTLWPIACTGSLPTWGNSMVMEGQDAETVAVLSRTAAVVALSLSVQSGAAWAKPAQASRVRANRWWMLPFGCLHPR